MSFHIRVADADVAGWLQASFEERMPWKKPAGYFHTCCERQARGDLVLLYAERNGTYLGHVKIVWEPGYPYFRARAIPEIQDLNVVPTERRRGVGSGLLTEAEAMIHRRSPTAGIGAGMYADYGAAQRLYVTRGYVPDGQGLWYRDHYVRGGEAVVADDDLILYFTKALKAPAPFAGPKNQPA